MAVASSTAVAAAASGIVVAGILVYVAVIAGFAWGGAVLAKGRGQSQTTGAILGGILGVLGIIIILCMADNSRSSGRRRGRQGTGRVTRGGSSGTGRIARGGTDRTTRGGTGRMQRPPTRYGRR